jgi:DNA polymerase-1
MSAFGLTRSTDLTLGEAEDFLRAYFARFPGVRRYLDAARRQALESEYVETLLGRRRRFPGLRSQSNANIRAREEREAVNAPIQGTAADIMKLAMLRMPDALAEAGLSARIMLQVHDELVLECPQDETAATMKIVKQVMENAYSLKIPLTADVRSGLTWGEMETE